jgi:hypothetical protein
MGTISKEEAAYLAGIIDGEGTLHVDVGLYKNSAGNRTPRVACRIGVVNTSPQMIRRVSEIYHTLGVRFFYTYERGEANGWKDRLRIFVCHDRAVQHVLRVVLPFLSAKREEALAVVDFIDWRVGLPKGPGYQSYRSEKIERGKALKATLSALRSRRFNFQRLPRPSSEILPWSDEGIVQPSAKA